MSDCGTHMVEPSDDPKARLGLDSPGTFRQASRSQMRPDWTGWPRSRRTTTRYAPRVGTFLRKSLTPRAHSRDPPTMSVATIDHTTDTATPDSRHRIVDVTAWLDHSASLRRPFTG